MVSLASPANPNPAPLEPEADLAACQAEFQALVSSDQPLLRTLAANNLTLPQLFQLITSLPFQENFEALRELQASQVLLLHQVATFDAIRALQDVCRSNATATERRLAATKILSLNLSQDAINEPNSSPRRSSSRKNRTRDTETHASTEDPPAAPHQTHDSHHAESHHTPAPHDHPPHPRRTFIENPEITPPHAAPSSTAEPAPSSIAHDLISPEEADAAIQSAARHFAQAIGIPSPFDFTNDLAPQQAPNHAYPDFARSPPPPD